MKNICFSIFCVLVVLTANAQDFIQKGVIEFEKKTNFKKMMGEFSQPKGMHMGSDQMPEYQVSKQQLIFSGDRLLYKPVETNNNMMGMGGGMIVFGGGGDGKAIFTNLAEKKAIFRASLGMEDMLFEDSLRHVRWKIEDETRKIAGWKCRKAVGVIMDSVYVVAFYCPEIIPQGGPEFVTGLPGMVLGLAIPRLYTTWFATKVQVSGVDEKKLQPPVPAKKEKILTMEEARKKWRELYSPIIRKEAYDDEIDYMLKGLSLNRIFRP